MEQTTEDGLGRTMLALTEGDFKRLACRTVAEDGNARIEALVS